MKLEKEIKANRLGREIIATALSGIIVNQLGPSVIYRTQEETGASIAAIVRAFMIIRVIFNLAEFERNFIEIETSVKQADQSEIAVSVMRFIRRTVRWFLKNQPSNLSMVEVVQLYQQNFDEINTAIPAILGAAAKVEFERNYQNYLATGVSPAFANALTLKDYLFYGLDIICIAKKLHMNVVHVAEVYFMIDTFLDIAWIRNAIMVHAVENTWESLCRESLRDDLDLQMRQLTEGLVGLSNTNTNYQHVLETWAVEHDSLIGRWQAIVHDLKTSLSLNYMMFFVATRKLADLTQMTLKSLCT